MRRFSLFAVVAATLTVAAAQVNTLKAVTFFPVGENVAALVSIDPPKSAETALATLQKQMKAHPKEALTLALGAEQGKPLPYQGWFGITKKEYEAALSAKMVFNTLETQPLTVSKLAGDGSVVKLSAAGTLKPLDGIKVNFRTNKVTFPEGVSGTAEEITVTDEAGLGPRQGWMWTLEQGDPLDDNFKAGRLVALKLNDSGNILLNYQMQTPETDFVEFNILLNPVK